MIGFICGDCRQVSFNLRLFLLDGLGVNQAIRLLAMFLTMIAIWCCEQYGF